jgi:hypothetical protein
MIRKLFAIETFIFKEVLFEEITFMTYPMTTSSEKLE